VFEVRGCCSVAKSSRIAVVMRFLIGVLRSGNHEFSVKRGDMKAMAFSEALVELLSFFERYLGPIRLRANNCLLPSYREGLTKRLVEACCLWTCRLLTDGARARVP